jgi:hypothetical protein
MSANVLAFSQETRRLLSCHGQIKRKTISPSKPMALGLQAELIASQRGDPDVFT